jgi:hypothetical protein
MPLYQAEIYICDFCGATAHVIDSVIKFSTPRPAGWGYTQSDDGTKKLVCPICFRPSLAESTTSKPPAADPGPSIRKKHPSGYDFRQQYLQRPYDTQIDLFKNTRRETPLKSPPRTCLETNNPCGTDTWPAGKTCPCTECQLWLMERDRPRQFTK